MRQVLVASMYVVRSAQVLLVRHRVLDRWLAPGGHLLEGEAPHECAVREVAEETGVSADVVSQAPCGTRYERAGVLMLPKPIAVQLEDISADLRHVDFVYAGTATDTRITRQETEVADAVWADHDRMIALDVPANVTDIACLALQVVSAAQDLGRPSTAST
jgi:8-oxo-dGTP pyrophosphatase MutT (NUDIX family)